MRPSRCNQSLFGEQSVLSKKWFCLWLTLSPGKWDMHCPTRSMLHHPVSHSKLCHNMRLGWHSCALVLETWKTELQFVAYWTVSSAVIFCSAPILHVTLCPWDRRLVIPNKISIAVIGTIVAVARGGTLFGRYINSCPIYSIAGQTI